MKQHELAFRRIAVVMAALATTVAVARCSSDRVGPDISAVPVSLQLSRDSVRLIVGASTRVWIDARNASGVPIFPSHAVWESAEASIATATPDSIVARSIGSTFVRVSVGAAADTLFVEVVAPIDRMTLTGPADTVVGLSSISEIRAQAFAGAEPRAGKFAYLARDTTVFTITSPDPAGRAFVRVNGTGATWVVAQEVGGATDSIRVKARLVPPQFAFNSPVGYTVMETRLIHPSVVVPANYPLVPVPAVIASEDTMILAPDTGGTFRGKKAGRTVITAVDTAGRKAVSEVIVRPLDTAFAGGGSGHLRKISLGQVAYVVVREGSVANVASSDETVLTAVTTSQLPAQVRYEAHALGTAVLNVSAAGWESSTDTVTVTPSRFAWNLGAARSTVVGFSPTLNFLRQGDFGSEWAAAVEVTVTSSDSTVLRVAPTDRVISIPARPPCCGRTITVTGMSPGHAVLTVSAPGYAPLEQQFDVLSGKKLTLAPHGAITMGVRQSTKAGNYHQAWIVDAGSYTPPLDVSITHSSPSVAQSIPVLQLPGSGFPEFNVDTYLPGVDTVIVSAPGYLPDTAVLTVTSLRMFTSPSITVERRPWAIGLHVGDTLGNYFNIRDTLYLHGTSSNAAIATVAWDSATAHNATVGAVTPASSVGIANLNMLDTGQVHFTFTEESGKVPPVGVDVHLVANTSLRAAVSPDDPLDRILGRGQRGGAVTASSTALIPPTITSSDTSVLRLGSANGAFYAVGGTTSGTARFSATLPYHVGPAYTDFVEVGEPRLTFSVVPNAVTANVNARFRVRLSDQRGRTRQTDVPVQIRIEELDGGAVPLDATIPPGASETPDLQMKFTRGGRLRVVVRDNGSGMAYRPDTVLLDAASRVERTIRLPLVAVVAAGQTNSVSYSRINLLPGDTLPISMVSRRGYVTVPPTLTTGDLKLSVTGVRPGEDYIVLTPQSGVTGDSMRVVVTEGRFISFTSDTLKVGQLSQAYVRMTDSIFSPIQLSKPSAIWITSSALQAFRLDTVSIDSLVMPAATPPANAYFLLRARSPGTVSYTLSSPGYMPFTRSVVVIP